MVIISEIVNVVKTILAIRKQRQDNNDAYQILLTTLKVNIPILERMDAVFGEEEATALARNELHDVVTRARSTILRYEDLSFQINIQDYSQNFITLHELFEVCTRALVLFVSFSTQDRTNLNRNLNPPPIPPRPPNQHGIHAVADAESLQAPSLTPGGVKALLELRNYKQEVKRLEQKIKEHS